MVGSVALDTAAIISTSLECILYGASTNLGVAKPNELTGVTNEQDSLS